MLSGTQGAKNEKDTQIVWLPIATLIPYEHSGEARAYNTLMGTFNTTIKNLYFILNYRMPDTQTKASNDVFNKIRRG